MNTKHTPGPITVIRGFDATGFCTWEVLGKRVHLYRAAPALLEALETLSGHIYALIVSSPEARRHEPGMAISLREAQAAIAKARGEA